MPGFRFHLVSLHDITIIVKVHEIFNVELRIPPLFSPRFPFQGYHTMLCFHLTVNGQYPSRRGRVKDVEFAVGRDVVFTIELP